MENHSKRNPLAIRRLMREAKELNDEPSSDFYVNPNEDNILEWHFTICGPPNSPYENGLYHGVIVLSPDYPRHPPSFKFLQDTGRFVVNKEICLSITPHHVEEWLPAWGIRTALTALRSFMNTEAEGASGGLDGVPDDMKKLIAKESIKYKCLKCNRTNKQIYDDLIESIKEKEKYLKQKLAITEKENALQKTKPIDTLKSNLTKSISNDTNNDAKNDNNINDNIKNKSINNKNININNNANNTINTINTYSRPNNLTSFLSTDITNNCNLISCQPIISQTVVQVHENEFLHNRFNSNSHFNSNSSPINNNIEIPLETDLTSVILEKLIWIFAFFLAIVICYNLYSIFSNILTKT